MAHDEDAKREAHAKHQKTVFIIGMIGVKVANGVLIEKDCLGFLKGDLVFSLVLPALLLVPLETDVTHMYTIRIIGPLVKSFSVAVLCCLAYGDHWKSYWTAN